jgi:YtkA-like protein
MHLQMGTGWSLKAAVLLAAICLAECHRPVESTVVLVEHEITPQPTKVGVTTTIGLRLTGSNGDPVSGARVQVEATMAHPGMPPVFNEAREAGSGKYQTSVEFMMAGDWVVLLHITLADGRQLERQFDVKGVRPG